MPKVKNVTGGMVRVSGVKYPPGVIENPPDELIALAKDKNEPSFELAHDSEPVHKTEPHTPVHHKGK